MEVTGFNPTSGGVGAAVTVSLSNVPQGTEVANTKVELRYGGGLDVTEVSRNVSGDGFVTGTVSEGSRSGAFIVSVDLATGSQTAESTDEFTVTEEPNAEPQFTSLRPRSVQLGQPTLVTLTGSNLESVTMLRIGTMSVNVLTHTDTTITANVTVNGVARNQSLRISAMYAGGTAICPFPLLVQ
jgi:hypothetical protein